MADPTSLSPPAWEFHLPLSPTDLLRSAGSLQYTVQEVLPLRELPRQLAGWWEKREGEIVSWRLLVFVCKSKYREMGRRKASN